MTIELHHFFILTDKQDLLCAQIASIGLVEGSSNNHPGQGTANRRFFLPNSALELIYLRDEKEALQGRGSRLRFVERESNPFASPFGLIVRDVTGSAATPFPGWRYYPEYFATDQSFLVGENSDLLEEPLCICMPANLSRPEIPPAQQNPDWVLTELRIGIPVNNPSPPLAAIARCKGVSMGLDEPHRLEIVFNKNDKGRTMNMMPEIPLVIYW